MIIYKNSYMYNMLWLTLISKSQIQTGIFDKPIISVGYTDGNINTVTVFIMLVL